MINTAIVYPKIDSKVFGKTVLGFSYSFHDESMLIMMKIIRGDSSLPGMTHKDEERIRKINRVNVIERQGAITTMLSDGRLEIIS